MKLIPVIFSIYYILFPLISVLGEFNRPPENTSTSRTREEPRDQLNGKYIDLKDFQNTQDNYRDNILKCSVVNYSRTNVMQAGDYDWSKWKDRNRRDHDIVLGEKKRTDAFERTDAINSPYAVLIAIKHRIGKEELETLCSGSLLMDRWILTAGHCLIKKNHKPSDILLYIGGDSLEEVVNNKLAKGSQVETSNEFYVHPEYDIETNSYDVAVIKTFGKFYLSKTVNVVGIDDEPLIFNGHKECYYTGFGMVQVEQSHEEDMKRKTQKLKIEYPCRCESALKKILNLPNVNNFLCAMPMEDFGLCSGDSGGGLICDHDVTGIAVEVIQLKNSDTCELPSEPGNVSCGSRNTLSVFQSTHSVGDWIRTVISATSPKDIPAYVIPSDFKHPVSNSNPHNVKANNVDRADYHGFLFLSGVLFVDHVVN